MRLIVSLRLAVLAVCSVLVAGFDIDTSSNESVNALQELVIGGMLDYRDKNIPGMFQEPYYWWTAGVAYGLLLDYAYYTHNHTFDDMIREGLKHQAGPHFDLLPSNQSTVEGNDDQGAYAITFMSAAEKNFTEPDGDFPDYLYVVQSVFNQMVDRWETGACGGGLRWQIFPWNAGYAYKNTVSNGYMMHIAARLARFTGNTSYVEWADKIWDWETKVKFVDSYFNNDTISIFDGADMSQSCKDVRRLEWTYNSANHISANAFLYNMTNNTQYLDRAEKVWARAKVFFKNEIMYEAACQPSNRCNNDQRTFKGIFSQYLGLAMQMAPTMREEIMSYLQPTAQAVAQCCQEGDPGTAVCGFNWFEGKFDGTYGLGEQMCAMGVLNTFFLDQNKAPLTQKTGASSKGDSSAGTKDSTDQNEPNSLDLETKDKAGAGVITAIIVLLLCGVGAWLFF